MLKRLIKYFTAFVVLLHCLGLTQLASSYSKDSSAFTSMLNMSEEETKKEKEVKDDNECLGDAKLKYLVALPTVVIQIESCYKDSKSRLTHQYLAENPTPPPDKA